jgi:multisubunit Na+/H+ antiporter MnhC subunit
MKAAVGRSQPITSSKDRQLVLMLLIDIVIYIAFSAVMVVILMRQQIIQYQTRDLAQIQFEFF